VSNAAYDARVVSIFAWPRSSCAATMLPVRRMMSQRVMKASVADLRRHFGG